MIAKGYPTATYPTGRFYPFFDRRIRAKLCKSLVRLMMELYPICRITFIRSGENRITFNSTELITCKDVTEFFVELSVIRKFLPLKGEDAFSDKASLPPGDFWARSDKRMKQTDQNTGVRNG